MSPIRKPSRLQLDLREETWVAPGRTLLPWPSRWHRSKPEPSPSAVSSAECTCPTGCIRDHETD